MAINLVQAASNTGSFTTSGTHTISCTFSSPVTSGDTIVAILGVVAVGASGSGSITGFADSESDSYTSIINLDYTTHDVSGLAIFYVPSCTGGSSFTVTATVDAPIAIATTFYEIILALEFSGMASPSVYSSVSLQNPTTVGHTSFTLDLNDSLGNTVAVTFANLTGIDATLAVVDFLAGSVNFMLPVSVIYDQTTAPYVPTATNGYTFVLDQSVANSPANLYQYNPGLPYGAAQQIQFFVVA